MKAAVFHKPGDISIHNVSDPHILSGAVPQKEDMIMGHEFMGIAEETGSAQ